MKKGFTLLELLIVIVIIGILAAIGIPRYFDAIQSARKSEALGTLSQIRQIEQAYYTINGDYMAADTSLNGDTLSVDLDNDGNPDMSLTVPNSPNYTYSITTAKALATKKGAAKKTYTMDLASGTWTET